MKYIFKIIVALLLSKGMLSATNQNDLYADKTLKSSCISKIKIPTKFYEIDYYLRGLTTGLGFIIKSVPSDWDRNKPLFDNKDIVQVCQNARLTEMQYGSFEIALGASMFQNLMSKGIIFKKLNKFAN
ncbi:MAG: hypothetical protein K8R39_11890 [Arcobacteraceae bacterium]|nr:hypothetical protein [Arcobacteraceae bacterium]